VFGLQSNHWLKGFECLDRSLKAERSGFDAMFGYGLSRDGADQVVVGQNILAVKNYSEFMSSLRSLLQRE
jgi:hypothetical protein